MGAQDVRAGRAFVELYANDSKLQQSLKRTALSFNDWGKQMVSLGWKFEALGASGVGFLAAVVKMSGEAAEHLYMMSLRTGITVRSLSALGYVASRTGSDLDIIVRGVGKMQRVLSEAADGSKSAGNAIREMGVSLDALRHLTPDQQFLEIARAISTIPDASRRASLAMAVFGSHGVGGIDMLPLFNAGPKAIEELMQRAKSVGAVQDFANVKSMMQMNQSIKDVWETVRALGRTITVALAPAIKEASQWLIKAARAADDWLTKHKPLVVMAGAASISLMALGSALISTGYAMQFVSGSIKGMLTPLDAVASMSRLAVSLVSAVGGGIISMMSGVVSAVLVMVNPITLAIAAIGILAYYLYSTSTTARNAVNSVGAAASTVGSRVKGTFTSLWEYLKAGWQTVRNDALTAFGGISDALEAQDWGLAVKILWTVIKLEFQRGMQNLWDPLVKGFYMAKFTIEDAWDNTVSALKYAWSYAVEYLSSWDGIKTAAMQFFNWLNNAWNTVIDALADRFAEWMVGSQLKDSEEKLRKLYEPYVKSGKVTQAFVEGKVQDLRQSAYDQLDKQSARRRADQQRKYEDKMNQLNADFRSKQPGLVAEQEKRRHEIEAKRSADRLKREQELVNALAAIDPARRQQIDALVKELHSLRDKAKNEKFVFDRDHKKEDQQPTSDAIESLDQKVKAAGTFNANALFGLAAEGPLNRIAHNTGETVRHLRTLTKKPQGMFYR